MSKQSLAASEQISQLINQIASSNEGNASPSSSFLNISKAELEIQTSNCSFISPQTKSPMFSVRHMQQVKLEEESHKEVFEFITK